MRTFLFLRIHAFTLEGTIESARVATSHPFLYFTDFPDGKFWTFQGYENNGGSRAMYSTMFWYLPANDPAFDLKLFFVVNP